jgi:hypothetical protein
MFCLDPVWQTLKKAAAKAGPSCSEVSLDRVDEDYESEEPYSVRPSSSYYRSGHHDYHDYRDYQ